jgi:uncharacterized protein (DUF1015 family)
VVVAEELEHGLSLTPFSAVRYQTDPARLGRQLCPPYDVISEQERHELVATADTNAVRLILPEAAESALGDGDPYTGAEVLLSRWLAAGILAVDPAPALYVYEMESPDGPATRGLLGAIELRDPEDGVILPHENTMAGPVADRLALMTATQANLEPIYLVYDGGGAASELVAAMSDRDPLAVAITPDGVTHRLWAEADPARHAAVAADLASRRALIADGHHRYATYRQLQSMHGGAPGPWDRGLALLVDSSSYGPQVHPIHRVIALGWQPALAAIRKAAVVSAPIPMAEVDQRLAAADGFAVGLTNGESAVVVTEVHPDVLRAGFGSADGDVLNGLDVSVLHKVLVSQVWGLRDEVGQVDYAHSVADAVAHARTTGGTAVLLRATPLAAVAAVAAAGQRMPRKSTLFTPKPASGVVIRRFSDQGADQGPDGAAADTADVSR